MALSAAAGSGASDSVAAEETSGAGLGVAFEPHAAAPNTASAQQKTAVLLQPDATLARVGLSH